MLVVEAAREVEQPAVAERGPLGHGDAHVEVLAGVAHLREQLRLHVAFTEVGRLELLVGLVEHLAHQRPHARHVDL